MTNNSNDFLDALANDSQADIVRLFPLQNFYLIDVRDPDDPDTHSEDEVTALIVDTEENHTIVVFTSMEMLEQFVEQTDMFDEADEVPSFLMQGIELAELLPPELGVLFNPESDDCFVISPEVFQGFKIDILQRAKRE